MQLSLRTDSYKTNASKPEIENQRLKPKIPKSGYAIPVGSRIIPQQQWKHGKSTWRDYLPKDTGEEENTNPKMPA